MNLYLRMFLVAVAALFKPRITPENPRNELVLCVLPNDLDINGHMNSGRFLTICDLTRIDLFVRTGLAKLMIKNAWKPIIVQHTMEYKKALRLFNTFTVSQEVNRWDDRHFYSIHRFTRGDGVVAEGTSVAVIRGKDGVISPALIVDALR